MFSNADKEEVRHIVQRILLPCVFFIGLLGNSISIYVLTRKRMRCTTNIYLTALAITDIIYLTTALLLSLQHYDSIQRYCEVYWMCYGAVVWLCDACAYTSIYIAVCFTIERFIAIRYPLKRKTFCTESLTKKIITGVALFCFIATISTAFEHDYRVVSKLVDNKGFPCLQTTKLRQTENTNEGKTSKNDNINKLQNYTSSKDDADRWLSLEVQVEMMNFSQYSSHTDRNLTKNQVNMHNKNVTLSDETPDDLILLNSVSHQCNNVSYYQNSMSSLANNEVYRRVLSFLTLFVFVLIPFCVLGTFNCFLIMLVRRSYNLRGEMTNANSIRRQKHKCPSSTVSQENRVTITLIAVVLLFIICQLPWSIYLIVSEHKTIEQNLSAIIGNVFNLLVAINAAANFFLYCVLSDKYRKTVRELITGYNFKQRNPTSVSMFGNTALTSTNGNRLSRYRPSSSSISTK